MHFIYSQDLFLIKKTVNKLINSINENNDYEVMSFSLIDDDLNEIISSVNTYSIFEQNKIVVIKDAWFATESKVANHKSYSSEKLLEFLNSYNQQNEIIFTLNHPKLSNRLKIVDYINKNMKVTELKMLTEDMIKKYISETFTKAGKDIEPNLVELIFNNIPNDMQLIWNELQKLIQLEILDEASIKSTMTKYIENDIFKISDAFIQNQVDDFLKYYRAYIQINDDLFSLFGLLASNLVLTRNVVMLSNQGMSQSQIIEITKSHPYRVKVILQGNNSDIDYINDKIKILHKIQKSIITNLIDKEVMAEYEFIRVMKKG